MKAMGAIGLELGAADVLYVPSTRKYYFLELNSAPTLDNDKITAFFQKAIKDKFKDFKPQKEVVEAPVVIPEAIIA
jgi:glutathione synthase/RimK-type ligase-like ATP-grasp enzyme